jgi:uncharacterized protein
MVPTGRISMVDALRGWALMGLFLVHCVERFELFWFAPVYDRWYDLSFGLFGGKAFAVFALLFGFSFATIMANERARGGDFTWRFVRRLVILFVVFGTLHTLFYRGEVLTVLAVMGLLLLPFDRVKSDKVLLGLAALAFLQLPLWWRWWAAGQGADWAMAPPLYASWGSLPTLAEGSFWQVAADNLGPGNVGKWSYYVESGRVRPVGDRRAAVLRLWAGLVGQDGQRHCAGLGPGGLCAAGGLRQLVVYPLPLWPTRMAVARRHAG